ncbi:MAG: resA 5 [Planctomycetota bacterium]|nr:resA 5 [Planctomycetota bacterium]
MRFRPTAISLCLLSSLLGPSARAQDVARPSYASLEELKASYAKQLLDLDRHRIADMAGLAAKQKGEDAETTYRELFHIAVVRDLYTEADPAADAYLKTESADPGNRAMAVFINVIEKANRGQYDESLADLTAFFQRAPVKDDGKPRLDPDMVIPIGEAYLQRLIRGGRYDIAKKVCELALARRSEPNIRSHFAARMARINMLDKPAPQIVGKDVDGKTIRLSDFKGKVVLVDFWATWCPPCVAMIPELQALQTRYGKDGFVILGVNLDARREDVGSIAKATPVVRQFLLDSRASWPSLLVGPASDADPAALFGVDEIPASFLIDRTGKVVHIELSGSELDKAIKAALK